MSNDERTNQTFPFPVRFSLRTLFVVVTVAGIGIGSAGWIGWNIKQVRQRKRMLTEPAAVPSQFLVSIQYSRTRKPPFLWRMLGAHGVREINLSTGATPADVELVRRLFPEAIVGVSRNGASDTATVMMVD